MAKIEFKNSYSERKTKPEFYTELDYETELTDQSQLCGASIVEMAKRFGIDAIIAKAEQMNATPYLQDQLYGHDLTNMYKSKEDMLTVKNKLNNLFENIPARMRKEIFNDKVEEFVTAYTTNDERKLETLANLGLVSKTQLESVKQWNAEQRQLKADEQTRIKFANYIEQNMGDIYEEYKKTGNININNNQSNTDGN